MQLPLLCGTRIPEQIIVVVHVVVVVVVIIRFLFIVVVVLFIVVIVAIVPVSCHRRHRLSISALVFVPVYCRRLVYRCRRRVRRRRRRSRGGSILWCTYSKILWGNF